MPTTKFSAVCTAAAILLGGMAASAAADDQTPAPTAPASAPAAGQGTPQSAKPNDPDEIICKREQVTGTRVARQKICMSRRDWDEEAEEASSRMHREQQKQDTDGRTKPIGPG
jgi:hypothetical protein